MSLTIPNASTLYATIPPDPKKKEYYEEFRVCVMKKLSTPQFWSDSGFNEWLEYNARLMDDRFLNKLIAELKAQNFEAYKSTVDDSGMHDDANIIPVLVIKFTPTKHQKDGLSKTYDQLSQPTAPAAAASISIKKRKIGSTGSSEVVDVTGDDIKDAPVVVTDQAMKKKGLIVVYVQSDDPACHDVRVYHESKLPKGGLELFDRMVEAHAWGFVLDLYDITNECLVERTE